MTESALVSAPATPSIATRFADFWRVFRRNKMGIVGFVMLLVIVFVAVFAHVIAPYGPSAQHGVGTSDIYNPPSAAHWFGTDDAGQDVFTNFVYGARVSLIVGFFAAFISVFIGGLIGIVAGYYGGRVENVLMRFNDIMLVIPDLPLMVVIVALTKPSLFNIIFVIGLLGWTTTSRIVRSQTLAVKSRKFVLRARAIGAGNRHIIRRHILPLVMPILVVNAVLVVSAAILDESVLSFLGLGDPTALSWGQMLNYAFGRGAMSTGAWWALIVPGFGIVWVVLGLTLFGHGLEQVLNPRLETHHLMRAQPTVRHEATGKPLRPGPRTRLPSEAPIVLQANDLSISYVSDDRPPARAVENVSFYLREGELMGLVGESGCGKTTLALSLLRLLPAAGQVVNGEIWFGDTELTGLTDEEMEQVRWKGISMVFQGAMNALNPVRTVGDQIAEAILQHGLMDRVAAERRVVGLLDLVGIAKERKDQYPHQYSGGMRQRAMIAMALACQPKLLFADEPTTALDVMIQAQILELLRDIQQVMGLAIVLVTHDLGVVAEICDSVVVMYGGKVAEYGPIDAVYNAPQHPYTQRLLEAFPDLNRLRDQLASIPGYPPRLNELPPGCRFEPRCHVKIDRCAKVSPELIRVSDADHLAGRAVTHHYAACHLLAGPEVGD